ncbi:TIGR03619 family F420-dependent LLM class oxidoreductase [Desertimonas flava]|jgi:probable F420-dependent oxidoreductase|uniref:TIGR03619 family F420-dependent LLM class oxidoreductase n=1 Tax=Desertimonas flava TaxID=2064846 RepID=UPI000E353A06|nr:TIGR03619 family F420-dependent LLM class oxidoreductase [Desertimonas flava]
MDIGVRVPCYRGWCRRSEAESIAVQAEETGFASLWVQDHLVAPVGTPDATSVRGLSTWMSDGPASAPPPAKTIAEYYAGDDWWIDPYAMWGFLAGITRRVRLASDILVIPYRHPVVQAKLIGSLDVLSGGRMIIGTGSGHVPAEAEALDVDFAARARLHDEYLRIIVAMLSNEEVAFDGEFHRFGPLRTMIRPVQQPHPPIWVGGNGRRAIRRAVELGQGWLPSVVEPDALARGIDELHRLAEEHGRSDVPTIAVSMPSLIRLADPAAPPSRRPPLTAEQTVGVLQRYADLGVAHVSLAFPTPSAAVYLRQMELFAEQVLPAFTRPSVVPVDPAAHESTRSSP